MKAMNAYVGVELPSSVHC